ncbi:MAG: hypothetical protein K6T71_05220 [Candidatus Bipolaricaulota bacterium]|nr:hypothetical protein [Candidatus Bipolaricaulota bacterium]
MPKEWTPEEVRRWILKVLYDVYMKSPTATMLWGRADFSESTDDSPSWEDIYREAEWLDWKGFIKLSSQAVGAVSARLTPAGREFVEQELLKPSSGA